MKTRISRFLWFVFGVVLNSFGIAFVTKAALGTSPISSLPYVLSFAFPLSLGCITQVFSAPPYLRSARLSIVLKNRR